jgi:hypothetical protein
MKMMWLRNTVCKCFRNEGKYPLMTPLLALERMRKEELSEFYTGTAGLLAQGKQLSFNFQKG